ncbi:MAG: transposase [Firmicutes bacterium]|nr:transposase [Bacillota bacterium]
MQPPELKTDANTARKALEALAGSLEKNYPGAAASLREGLEETITINRLMLTGALRRTLRSMNPIESAIEMARTTARRVKRWRNGNQVLRWTLVGLKEAERGFRRVAGYRELPLLRMNLRGEVLHTTTGEVANA